MGIRGETELGQYVARLFEECEKQHNNGEATVFDGRSIECGSFLNKETGMNPFCINRSTLKQLGLEPKPKEYLSIREFQRAAKTNQQRSRGKEIEKYFDELAAQNTQSGSVNYNVEEVKCGVFVQAGERKFCVHEDQVGKFSKPELMSPGDTTVAQSDGPANQTKGRKSV